MIIMMAALKEWAVVCKALEEGRQILLLRKGGIMEYRQGFEVKHDKFLLFPTFEHQSKESIQMDYLDKLYNLLQNAPTNGKNKMTSYAKVVEIKEVSDKSILHLNGLDASHGFPSNFRSLVLMMITNLFWMTQNFIRL